MSEMQWQTLPLDALKPASYNPRKKLKPGDKEYEKIKASIQEFGYVEPIIVNFDMTVIGGHQRLTVLRDFGYTEAQCVVLHIEDENKVKALNIALNKITGAWNEQLLADLLVDLQSVEFNPLRLRPYARAVTGGDALLWQDRGPGHSFPHGSTA